MPFDRGERNYAVHLHMFYRLTDSDHTKMEKSDCDRNCKTLRSNCKMIGDKYETQS